MVELIVAFRFLSGIRKHLAWMFAHRLSRNVIMCVCVHACVYVCVHVHVCVLINTHKLLCECILAQICAYIRLREISEGRVSY